jgi:hypothetical protein
VARRRRNPEIIAGRVNADGSIAAGDGFTVQKAATGIYNVFFPSSFRVIAASANRGDAPAGAAASISLSAQAIAVTMFATNTATNTDLPFTFIAVGVQQ